MLRDRHIRRDGKPIERQILLERGRLLRRGPRHRAAERPSALAQRSGQKQIAALFEPGAGKADEHPALLYKGLEPLARVTGEAAHVAQNDDRWGGGGKVRRGMVEIGRVCARDLGEGGERPFEVIGGGQQRLRLLAALARDEANAPPLRCAVEEIDRASRILARNFEAGDLIAKVEREIECGLTLEPAPVSNGAAARVSPRAVTAATCPRRVPGSAFRTLARMRRPRRPSG